MAERVSMVSVGFCQMFGALLGLVPYKHKWMILSEPLSAISRSRLSAGSRDDLTRDSAGAGGVVFERSHYFEEDNSDMTVDIYADLK